MTFAIRNYTSEVAAETTIARIECKLAAIGALGIAKTYGPDRQVTSVIFNMPDGARTHTIKVPANVGACWEALWKQYCQSHSKPRPEAKQRLLEQAHRTAWRLVQDWIEIQASMIIMKQAEPLEVFLPYVWDGKQTYFEALRCDRFKALPAPKSETQ